MSVPVGFTRDGKPAGVWLYAGFMQEPQLIAIGYAIEQLLQVHRPPHFAGRRPGLPPDAGLCDRTVAEQVPMRPEGMIHLGMRRHMMPGR
jgi:hypothetical protein